MRVFWKTETSLHGGRRGGVRENSQLASMERASPEMFLSDNSLVPACGPCSVDLSANSDLGASLFQVLGVTGLQRLSSCANWSFDEGCPNRVFFTGGYMGVFSCFYWYGACPKNETSQFFLFFSAHWPSATVR